VYLKKALPFLILLLAVISCKKDSGLITPNQPGDQNPLLGLNVVGKTDSGNFVIGKPLSLPNGNTIKIEECKFYLSDFSLIKEDGTRVELSEIVFFNFRNGHMALKTAHGYGENLDLRIPPGTYSEMSFGIGVKPELNNTDATIYPTGHPLNLYNVMYWDWASGYRFIVLEGKTDTSSTGDWSQTEDFVYHTGTNNLYREITLTFEPLVVKASSTSFENQLMLELDMEKLLVSESDTINTRLDNFSHTLDNPNLALRITEHFKNAFHIHKP